MVPKFIRVQGFLAFEDPVELNFEAVQYATVTGINGTGKSSLIVDAMLFALFGKARKRAEDLINDRCEEANVSLHFEHRGIKCCIQRSVRKGKSPVVSFKIDGLDKSERLATNTQKHIDAFLGFSQRLLTTITLAQQEDINALSEMLPGEREQLLSEMLSLQEWEVKRKKATEQLTVLKHYVDRSINVREAIVQLEDQIITLQQQLVKLDFSIMPLQKELEELTCSEQDLLLQLEQLTIEQEMRVQFAGVQGEIVQLEQQLANLQVTSHNSEQLQQYLLEAQIQITGNESAKQLLVDEHRTIRDEQGGISHLLQDVKLLEGQSRNINILEEVPCKPYPEIHNNCYLLKDAHQVRDVVATMLAEWQVPDLKTLIIFLENKSQDLLNKSFQINQEMIQYDNRLQIGYGHYDGLRNTILNETERQHIETIIHTRYEELKQLQVLVPAQDNSLQVIKDMQSLRSKLVDCRNTLRSSMDQRMGTAIKCTSLQESKVVLNQELAGLEHYQEDAIYYQALIQAYTDIPNLLVYEAVPWVETYANEILTKILPGATVQLRVYRETKAATQQRTLDIICTMNTGVREFANLSGSEKFRQSLAVRLALAKVTAELYGTSLDFFIIDEAFGCLDDTNLGLVKQALQEVSQYFKLFLVITHVTELHDTFNTEVRITNGQIQTTLHKQSRAIPLDI